jgi:hypothetical protein
MLYIKRFSLLREYLATDLKELLPDKNQLIDIIDNRFLDSEFRQACQDNGYLQLAASKLVSEKYDLGEGSIAILSSLESRFTFDKTVGGLKKLKERLGRESNMDSILDDIIEIEKNNKVEIDTDKQHIIFTSLLFDLMIVRDNGNISIKFESIFQVNYDEFVSVLVPVEEEIVLSDTEISKDYILRLVDYTLKKLNEEVISELKK